MKPKFRKKINRAFTALYRIKHDASAVSMTVESTILLLIGVLVAVFLIYWVNYAGSGEIGKGIGTRIFQAFTD